MELVEDVADYLDAQGAGTKSTDIFLQGLPARPVNCHTVNTTGGMVTAGNPITMPTFQILTRNKSKATGLTKSRQAYEILHDKWNVLSERLGRIKALAMPGIFYKDDSDNYVYTLNFILVLAPGTPGGS